MAPRLWCLALAAAATAAVHVQAPAVPAPGACQVSLPESIPVNVTLPTALTTTEGCWKFKKDNRGGGGGIRNGPEVRA